MGRLGGGQAPRPKTLDEKGIVAGETRESGRALAVGRRSRAGRWLQPEDARPEGAGRAAARWTLMC